MPESEETVVGKKDTLIKGIKDDSQTVTDSVIIVDKEKESA